jgi:hypothetical protein
MQKDSKLMNSFSVVSDPRKWVRGDKKAVGYCWHWADMTLERRHDASLKLTKGYAPSDKPWAAI